MRDLVMDFRTAIRRLMGVPGYSVAAVVTLALGVGPTAALFSVVDAVILKPLPYSDPQTLAWMWGTSASSKTERISGPDLQDFAAEAKGLERVAAFWSTTVDLYGGPETERIPIAAVGSGFFQALGVEPFLGRTFLPSEYSGGNENVAVLSYNFWMSRFGGDRGAIGRTLTMPLGRHEVYVIVGVMPPGFGLLPDVIKPSQRHDLWVPLDLSTNNMKMRRLRLLRAVARLRAGTTFESAEAELQAVASRLEQRFPESNRGWSVRLVPIREEMLSGSRQGITLLTAGAALLLLVACVNLANLMIVHAAGDQRNVAIRLALGASTLNILRYAAIPQSILALCGGLFGTLLAAISAKVCLAFAPTNIPRLDEAAITFQVAVVAVALAATCVTVAVVVPYGVLLRTHAGGPLRGEAGARRRGPSRRRLMGLLMVAEIGLTVLLLAAASSAYFNLARLLEVDPGFDPHGVLTMKFSFPTSAGVGSLRSELEKEIDALPSVRSAATGGRLPMDYPTGSLSFSTAEASGEQVVRGSGYYRVVSPSYFKTLRIPLLSGRVFSSEDTPTSFPVVIVSDSVARSTWHTENPIGKRILIEAFRPFTAEVVGVVGDVRETALSSEAGDALYLPCAQQSERRITLLARVDGDPLQAVAEVKTAIRRVAGNVSIHDVSTMDQIIADTLIYHQFVLALLLTLGLLAMGLASVGVYGVVSHWIMQRRHEIGVRMALGATPGEIARWLLGLGGRNLAIGLGAGALAALVGARIVSSNIPGVASRGVLWLLLPTCAVGASALLACTVPSLVAARLAPMTVLKDPESQRE